MRKLVMASILIATGCTSTRMVEVVDGNARVLEATKQGLIKVATCLQEKEFKLVKPCLLATPTPTPIAAPK